MTALLQLENVQAGYGAVQVLHGVSFDLAVSGRLALIGRNGVGKTTTMRCLIGLLRATSGWIRLNGEDVTKLPSDALARLGIGYIPQGREVFPRMTVAENLEVGRLIGGPRGLKKPDLVYEYFPRLKERRNQVAGTMSGGEQQQLAIGRVLIGNPSVMLLDEPSEGVQPNIVQMICEALKSIRKELGTTILFVEQNLDTILAISERCYVMEKGRIVAGIEPGLVSAESVRSHLLI